MEMDSNKKRRSVATDFHAVGMAYGISFRLFAGRDSRCMDSHRDTETSRALVASKAR